MTPAFIRTAGPRDLADVSALLSETWHATYDSIYGAARVSEITASWHSPQALAARLGRPNTEFVVADDGTRLLGMAYAAAGPSDARLVSLHQLYVRPDAQGRGIGRDLLAEIEASFPEAARLRLEVEEANGRAVEFYRKAGFVRIGATDHCGSPDSGLPAAILEKRIG